MKIQKNCNFKYFRILKQKLKHKILTRRKTKIHIYSHRGCENEAEKEALFACRASTTRTTPGLNKAPKMSGAIFSPEVVW